MELEDVARMLKLSASSVYRLTASASIPHFKIGRRLRFSRAAVQAWLDSHNVPMLTTSTPDKSVGQGTRETPPESSFPGPGTQKDTQTNARTRARNPNGHASSGVLKTGL